MTPNPDSSTPNTPDFPGTARTAPAGPPSSSFSIGLVAVLVLVLALAGGWAVFAGIIPLPGKTETPAKESDPGIELVEGQENTLVIPEEVRVSLGIRKANIDRIATAGRPTQPQTLVLPGSTALDPAGLMRVRARFAPAEVVEIASVPDDPGLDGDSQRRELRPGDKVRKGDLLGVFYSVDVGSKKNDLVDALLQLKLDEEILDRAEKVKNALADVFLLNARRNVEGDRNAIARALSNLRVWNIPEEDIQAVYKESEEIFKRKGVRNRTLEATWPRVELRAPDDGTIVERNVTAHEMVVDNTVNLFQIAKVDRLIVIANAPEDELPTLNGLSGLYRHWSVRTVGAEELAGISGAIEEIGYLLDPNQHTAVIKGAIENPGGRIRAGQFVSATISIPPPTDVVEIPADSVVDDGAQAVVFVQTDPDKHYYTMRRVLPTQRFDKTILVRSTLPEDKRSDEEKAKEREEEKSLGILPKEPLRPGEKVLQTAVNELKATLYEKQSKAASEAPKEKN
jgi:cobalt-zinc-cadmium efflux system membrane fusion protein